MGVEQKDVEVVGIKIAWENLANSIIERAVEDYIDARSHKNIGKMNAILRFFKSDYYCLLTNLPYTAFINKI